MSGVPASIWLAGCGNMGGAMLRGWIASGIPSTSITVIDPQLPPLPIGITCVPQVQPGSPEILVLAVKPQLMAAVARQFADAGVALGLPANQAQRFAIATVEGAAALAERAGDSPAMLAERVASPGGTTRAGLDVLDHDNALKRLIHQTLTAAAKRSAELAAAARD